MADVKITDLPQVSEVADNDVLILLDSSDTTAGPNGTDKRAVVSDLRRMFGKIESTEDIINGSFPNITEGFILESKRYSISRDFGGGQWKATSTTGLTPSQSPKELLAPQLVDGSGRLWELTPLPATKHKAYSARSLGVVGEGVEDDTNALKAGLFFGEVHGSDITCRVTSRIAITNDNSGLVGGITLVGDSSFFNRTDGAYNNDDGTILYVTGNGFVMNKARVSLNDNSNGSNTTTALVLRGIKFDVQNCEFDTFSKAKVVRIESGKEGSVFSYNYIHDCLMDSPTTGQLTAIDIDDNRDLGEGPSFGVEISKNIIKNMLVSQAFEDDFYYQTDGINISFAETSGISINNNVIINVGEGIDCFGHHNNIHNNRIIDSKVSGIKLINGASYNKVHDNIIIRPRTYGITTAGAGLAGRDVVGNDIYDNLIDSVNINSDSSLASYAIGVEGNSLSVPLHNTYRDNAFKDCQNASRLILGETLNDTNSVVNCKLLGGVPAVKVLNSGNMPITFSRKSRVRAFPNAVSLPPGGVTISFPNVVYDALSEISTGQFVAYKPATLSVSFGLRTGAANAGSIYTIILSINGNVIAREIKQAPENGDFFMRISEVGVAVNEGDSIGVYISHNESSGVEITSSDTLTLSIAEM